MLLFIALPRLKANLACRCERCMAIPEAQKRLSIRGGSIRWLIVQLLARQPTDRMKSGTHKHESRACEQLVLQRKTVNDHEPYSFFATVTKAQKRRASIVHRHIDADSYSIGNMSVPFQNTKRAQTDLSALLFHCATQAVSFGFSGTQCEQPLRSWELVSLTLLPFSLTAVLSSALNDAYQSYSIAC